ncbi:methyltransferase domain-containing protein [Amycolatopsis benzoatilytica]|uniref:methyltransferase domain-containing protein n=1 Tax=Amycolatopsis benzoatilytica TaxID=346045 RepID=UPI0003769F7E|nr:methyltransferase domain-containing protein [Amycolatopsis benzoatilytica]
MAETFGVPGPGKIDYYARVAEAGRDYKRQVLAALELRPGLTVLDLGCGPGTDLPAMADAVAPTGSVLGIDVEPAMVAEAGRRVADLPRTEVRRGDAHAVPLAGSSVDRARADRMVQHVADPSAVFAELYRVLRPGGLICAAEPDWDSLVVDPGSRSANRAFNRFVCSTMVRNPTVGRELPRLALSAGFEVRDVTVAAPVFRDFASADKILGLSRNTERGIRAGQLDPAEGEQWLADLSAGPFLAASMVFVGVFVKPAGGARPR